MLDERDARKIDRRMWKCVDIVAQLPIPHREFFRRSGATPASQFGRRSFHRFHCPGEAVLTWREMTLGVYTVNVSRQGMGLITPVQLFPKDQVVLQLWDGSSCRLEVARCRRLGIESYECGCRFVIGRQMNKSVTE